MDDKEISQFYGEQKEEKDEKDDRENKSHKRRKITPDCESLRSQARVFCASVTEWHIVRKYKAEKLQSFIEEKKYEQSKEIEQAVFDSAHKVLALLMDKISRGDGHVHEQIMRDLSLRKALGEGLQEYIVYLNNKIKIIALLSIDVFNGKNKQRNECGAQSEPRVEVMPDDYHSGECQEEKKVE
jgi:hypothetical protein